jgi:hypothetical protein
MVYIKLNQQNQQLTNKFQPFMGDSCTQNGYELSPKWVMTNPEMGNKTAILFFDPLFPGIQARQ